MIYENTLSAAIKPKLSKVARERIEDLIAVYEGSDDEDSQWASDIQFLLDYHDQVHAVWENND